MNEHIEFSLATSIFCRVMQVVTVAAIGLFVYHSYLTANSDTTVNTARIYLQYFSQEQRNVYFEADGQIGRVTLAYSLFSLSTALLLVGIFRLFGRLADRPFDFVNSLRVVRFLGVMFVLKAIIDFFENPTMSYLWMMDNSPEYRFSIENFGLDLVGIGSASVGFTTLTQLAIFLIGLSLVVAGNLAVSAVRRGALAAGALVEAEEDFAEAEEELHEAEEELAEAEAELEEAEEDLANAEAQLQSADSPEEVIEAIEDLEEAKEEIAEAQEEIEEARVEIAEAVEELAEAEAKLDALKTPGDPEKTS